MERLKAFSSALERHERVVICAWGRYTNQSLQSPERRATDKASFPAKVGRDTT
ncbi:MAG: hypothetical protein QXS54_06515 [Candidatus Methanomethylicaceae archaeon]